MDVCFPLVSWSEWLLQSLTAAFANALSRSDSGLNLQSRRVPSVNKTACSGENGACQGAWGVRGQS